MSFKEFTNKKNKDLDKIDIIVENVRRNRRLLALKNKKKSELKSKNNFNKKTQNIDSNSTQTQQLIESLQKKIRKLEMKVKHLSKDKQNTLNLFSEEKKEVKGDKIQPKNIDDILTKAVAIESGGSLNESDGNNILGLFKKHLPKQSQSQSNNKLICRNDGTDDGKIAAIDDTLLHAAQI